MHAVFRTIAAFAIAPVCWYLVLFLSLFLASFHDPWLDMGRVWPYSHTHLREEYIQGTYSPLADPVFLLTAFVRNIIPFIVAGFLTTRLLDLSPRLALGTLACSLVLVEGVFYGPAVVTLFLPFVIEVILGLSGVAPGFVFGNRKNDRSASH